MIATHCKDVSFVFGPNKGATHIYADIYPGNGCLYLRFFFNRCPTVSIVCLNSTHIIMRLSQRYGLRYVLLLYFFVNQFRIFFLPLVCSVSLHLSIFVCWHCCCHRNGFHSDLHCGGCPMWPQWLCALLVKMHRYITIFIVNDPPPK